MSLDSWRGELPRPVAPQARWWIVGSVFVILGAWQMAFHFWLMNLPMLVGHRVNALVGAVLVAGVVLATFVLIQRYEQSLADAAAKLREANEALRALEALVLLEIDSRCDIALGLAEPGHAVETLRVVKERVTDMSKVARGLIEMKQDGSGLVEPLPAILDEYEQHREELLKIHDGHLHYLKEHPGFAELMASFTGRRAADLLADLEADTGVDRSTGAPPGARS
jgi:hypothetical protein